MVAKVARAAPVSHRDTVLSLALVGWLPPLNAAAKVEARTHSLFSPKRRLTRSSQATRAVTPGATEGGPLRRNGRPREPRDWARGLLVGMADHLFHGCTSV